MNGGINTFNIRHETGPSSTVYDAYYIPESNRDQTLRATIFVNAVAGAKYSVVIRNTSGASFDVLGSSTNLMLNYFQGYLVK